MMTIKDFRKIRRDGKVIDESMRAIDMVALGWTPDKVLEIQWNNDSKLISFKARYGVLGMVIPGREAVAVIEENDESGQRNTLSVINVDGSRRMQFSNIQKLQGEDEMGQFCWFEPARIALSNVFGVIFNRASDNLMFHLDIDASDGNVVGVYPVR